MDQQTKDRLDELGRKKELSKLERGELRAIRSTLPEHEKQEVDAVLGETTPGPKPDTSLARGIERGRRNEREREPKSYDFPGQGGK